jgi:ketosteroid isomerase-like protein
MSNETLDLAKKYIAGLARKDPAAIIAVLHDDVVVEEANPLVAGVDKAGSKRCQGEAVRAFMRDLTTMLSKVEFTDVVWRTTNDGLVLFEATGDMALADGKPYSNSYLMVFESKDGKLIRVKEFMNPVTYARAVGMPLEQLP